MRTKPARIGQGPERRIYAQYRARVHSSFVNEYGVGRLRLHLARQWKRPCSEIKVIVARRGEPA